jgi:hypothetical protein
MISSSFAGISGFSRIGFDGLRQAEDWLTEANNSERLRFVYDQVKMNEAWRPALASAFRQCSGAARSR